MQIDWIMKNDANKDGTLTEEEFRKVAEQQMENWRSNMYKNYERNRDRINNDFQRQKTHFDANKDQMIESQMFMFHQNDVDGDGKIEAKEIRASIEKQIEENKEKQRRWEEKAKASAAAAALVA